MNTARTETAPSQTVEAQDVGDLIGRGRFPLQLEQDTDEAAAATAEANGRIDVRDFSQVLSGLAVPADAAPAESAPAADPTTEPTPAAAPVARRIDWAHVRALVVADVRGAGTWTAAKWKAETARRTELRDAVRPALQDAKREHAKEHRKDPKSGPAKRTRKELNRLRRANPAAMWQVATGGLAATAVLGLAAVKEVSPAGWLWTGAAALGAAGMYALALIVRTKLRPRAKADPNALVPTEEETRLMERLAPEYWAEHAEERGLDGTITGRPELGTAGIEAAVRLDGKWTLAKLLAAEESIRALLGARTDLRIQVAHGSHGGWAALALRTRSAADGDDLTWSPEHTSFGIDTVTGETVEIPLGHRLLIAGMSGAGKSVASRPLLRNASEGVTDVLIIIDFKKVEGRLWDHRARVASTAVDAVTVTDELIRELTYRLDALPKGKASWTPSTTHPRIHVVVDEGTEAVGQASCVPVVVGYTEKGKEIVEKRDAVEGLESLARMGRAGEIHLWWMTQKPTMSGNTPGIPSQIASQVGIRICLAVNTPGEARTVLGEDAQAKGWNAEDLPAPGVALVRYGKRKPNPVAVRFMSDEQVIALPDRPIWHLPEDSANHESPETTAAITAAAQAPTDLALVSDTGTDDDQADDESPAALVLAALADAPLLQKDIQTATGLPKSTLSRTITTLISDGKLIRQEDKTLAPVQTDNAATGA